ncbi:bile acid:sodium symporter [Candidatus Pelagisphaera phototrophica]|uniref:bile acid:sodium symporter n=1 Tax=Candidatus Pelagisphaera phototrophica TaxID=2684113 RepID=UPI0019E6650D|nr:bile acid:sodium symporter [Candidatus Pelagisphaera phototrophica]QXD32261.1 bile acid:sodium symporter [Candidatus Pelagisphaera phototrophica]
MLTPTETNLLILMTFVIMFGLGCTLSIRDFREAIRHPKPAIVGFLSQYLIMPALAFGMVKFFSFSDPVAIGLIIVACCPSGTTSSLFNYFAKGDLALSISLSTLTTTVALFALPILLGIYATPFTNDQIQIDFGKVIGSLIICLVPVVGGMYLKSKSERWGKNMEETGGVLGIIVIIFLIISWLPRNFERMMNPEETSPFILVASIFLGLGGFLFGYYFSRFLGMNRRKSRTVSLETGIQNGPLAFAIITLSFSAQVSGDILWPALLYSFFIVNTSTLVTYLIRKYTREEWFRFENETVKEEIFTSGWLKL